jgi:sodium-dependent dicarboxylate transporter 2/3/5
MGGFLLALAMERWGLHRRIALLTITAVGTRPTTLIAGFMLATAMLSMWVSNTATAVMMLPIAASVIALVEERTEREQPAFALCTLLGIAYAASIGGVGTPIGTPPNTILLGFLRTRFELDISFATWLGVGLPIVAVFLPLAWIVLTRFVYPVKLREIPGGRSLIREQLHKLGPMSRAEWSVLVVFIVTVSAWIFRSPLTTLLTDDAGVSPLDGVTDTVIAIAAGVALFVIPVSLRRGEFLLDWETARKLPWGVLLLFGGGLSLAAAVKSSGLDAFIGAQVAGLGGLPTVLLIAAVAAVVIFLTELTSNTATATIFVTLLAGVAIGIGVDPLLLCVPAAIGASCAFMMPVATPPNAIIFASGKLTIPQMARAGLVLNILSVVIVTVAAYTVVVWVLGAQTSGLPAWAAPAD